MAGWRIRRRPEFERYCASSLREPAASSSNSWRSAQPAELELKDVFARTLAVFGAERIFFGTDSSVFPRGWRRDLYEEQKRALDALDASESEQNLVFGENLIEQLGL